METDLIELKPIIRSILLALGRQATETEFRREFYNVEGSSFNEVLAKFKTRFAKFMKTIPDVCKVKYVGNDIVLFRVSNAESSHMDELTIKNAPKRLRSKPKRFRPGFR